MERRASSFRRRICNITDSFITRLDSELVLVLCSVVSLRLPFSTFSRPTAAVAFRFARVQKSNTTNFFNSTNLGERNLEIKLNFPKKTLSGDINREIEKIALNWKEYNLTEMHEKSLQSESLVLRLMSKEETNFFWRRKVTTHDDMVFKLCLSTLIGNLLLKEFFIFFPRSMLCCCRSFHASAGDEQAKQELLAFRQSFHPLSPHWHWAIKYLSAEKVSTTLSACFFVCS